MKYKYYFEDTVQNLEKSVDALLQTIANVRESERFQKLLGVVLQVGNSLNKDQRKGGAVGFKLKSLIRLTESKTNSKTTLLEYLITHLEKSETHKNILELHEDFPDVEACSHVSYQTMKVDRNKLRSGIKLIENGIKNAEKNDDSIYENDMSTFLNRASLIFDGLDNKFKSLETNFQDLKLFLGEKGKIEPEALFTTIFQFITYLKNTRKKIKEKREADAKKEQRKKAKADKLAKMQLKKDLAASVLGGPKLKKPPRSKKQTSAEKWRAKIDAQQGEDNVEEKEKKDDDKNNNTPRRKISRESLRETLAGPLHTARRLSRAASKRLRTISKLNKSSLMSIDEPTNESYDDSSNSAPLPPLPPPGLPDIPYQSLSVSGNSSALPIQPLPTGMPPPSPPTLPSSLPGLPGLPPGLPGLPGLPPKMPPPPTGLL